MKARSFWVYTVLRILFFAVPFTLLMLLPIGREFYWLSAIFAALIGLSLSILLLRKPLDEVTSSLAARRARSELAVSDEEIEDAALDATSRAGGEATEPRDSHAGGVATSSADERPEQEPAVGEGRS